METTFSYSLGSELDNKSKPPHTVLNKGLIEHSEFGVWSLWVLGEKAVVQLVKQLPERLYSVPI